MPSPLIAFRAIDDLANQISSRVDEPRLSMSDTARRDLERYYDVLRRELPQFSLNEAMMLADIANGTLWEPFSVNLLWAEVSDALDEGIAEKWGVDGVALVARLKTLNPAANMALVDALERAWLGPDRIMDMRQRLRTVGLIAE